MKNLNQMNCVALSSLESQQINGGSDTPKANVWQELVFISGGIVNALVVFGTQAGRNAGLCVK